MSVRWGRMVTNLPQVEQAAADGFDFVQPVNDLVTNLSEEQLLLQQARVRSGGLPFEICALPLPTDVRVSEKGFNIYVWIEFLKNAAQRMAGLGCKKLIWNDGRARVLPIEGANDGLLEQVRQFLYLLCGAAENFGMIVLVEPLGPRRTNFLNTLKETGDFLSRVSVENLSSMISLRELTRIGLPLPDLARYRELIRHVQLDNPRSYDGERICPRPGDGSEYLHFLKALKDMDYSGDISLPADADAGGLAYCREIWNGVLKR